MHGAPVLHHIKRDMEAITLCTKNYLEDCLLINDYYFEEKLGGKGMIGYEMFKLLVVSGIAIML